MSVQACADLVRRGDPDRVLATMAAPMAARAVLFPPYAFNLADTKVFHVLSTFCFLIFLCPCKTQKK